MDWIKTIGFGEGGWGWAFLGGAGVTLTVGLGAIVLGFILGAALGAAARNKVKPIAYSSIAFSQLIRGVPELLVIYLVFFGSGQLITVLSGGHSNFLIPPIMVGILALGLSVAAYSSEVFRSAMDAVPKGTIEAANALGLTRRSVFFRIVLPQMWRFALPGLTNISQNSIKDTALVSVIAVGEIMRVSHTGSNATRDPFLFYGTATMMFLVFGLMIDRSSRMFETRLDRWAAPNGKN